jgi:hypothetical protein
MYEGMASLRQYFNVQPVDSPEASAAAYVPLVMVSRVLAILRTLVVARILGDAGQTAFGQYQPALELTNPLVALVLFGAGDVAERYVSRVQRERGELFLHQWLKRLRFKLMGRGFLALLVLAAFSPWLSAAVWGTRNAWLLVMCGVTVLLLSYYQFQAAVLRGRRAYFAAAGMEIVGAAALLVFSMVAAFFNSAADLMAAYSLSLVAPLAIYEHAHWRVFGKPTGTSCEPPSDEKSLPGMGAFGAWSLVRLLLVMLFGFLSIWGVRYVADGAPAGSTHDAAKAVAQFSMPYRIAQVLGFLAITLWGSSYGIAARAWSHGRVRRANVEFFRMGRWGAAGLTALAVVVLLMRSVFAWMLPTYAGAIDVLLPGLLGVFIWYSLVAFLSTLADLSERPWFGAALWGMAAAVQLGGIAAGRRGWVLGGEPEPHMLLVSAAGLLAALVLVAPLTVCRPMRFTATGVPLGVLAAAALALQCPPWVVDWIAVPVLGAALLFLYISGLLVRPGDWRSLRRGGPWGARE